MLKGRRFTPAMIVAMIALAVALSGTAVAGTTKLITGSQIANGTIKLADIHSSAKTALKGQSGANGAQGPAGAQGAKGPVGPQGATGAKGDTGATGAPGPAGAHGKDGLSGLVTRHYDYIKDASYPGAGSGGIATVACDDAHHRLLPRPHGLGDEHAQGQPARRLDRPAQHHPVRGHARLGDLCERASRVVTPCCLRRARADRRTSARTEGPGLHPTRPFCHQRLRRPLPGSRRALRSTSSSVVRKLLSGRQKPSGWIVQGFNSGADPVIVRPWVICATVNG
jgi:hypothetical protein